MERITINPSKSIFDLTTEEMEIRLTPALIKLKEELFSKGLPLTYQDDRCPTEDHYVQEYEDGTCFLALLIEESVAFITLHKLTKS